jgi:D-alanyl-D-alanine carboxypeptidase (penicillin-binding protein 5/6)
LDADTVIFEKNPDQKMYPASITKIMTYIIVVQEIQDLENTKVQLSRGVLDSLQGTGSSLSGLKPGETLTIKQLLCALMISSGNDAAVILAHHVGGGDIPSFVAKMNQKAEELGCHDTHFVNPHGLHNEQHYTTASDILKITKFALDLPNFKEITSQETSYALGNGRYPLITTNFMIDPNRGKEYFYKYATGIKTGHTDEAGHCIVASAEKNSYHYLSIVLGDFDPKKNYAMIDSKNLFEWAFNNMQVKPILDKNKPLGEVALNFVWQKDRLSLVPLQDYSAILPKNVDSSSIDVSLDVPKSVDAPVAAGDKIGKATLTYANQTVAQIDLVAAESVEKNGCLFFIHCAKNVLSSKWLIIGASSLVSIILIYIAIVFIVNRRRQKFGYVNSKRRRRRK